ncbi:MAG: hypothetical protein ACREQV_12420, partial [Candidatus Binatia bacterium]
MRQTPFSEKGHTKYPFLLADTIFLTGPSAVCIDGEEVKQDGLMGIFGPAYATVPPGEAISVATQVILWTPTAIDQSTRDAELTVEAFQLFSSEGHSFILQSEPVSLTVSSQQICPKDLLKKLYVDVIDFADSLSEAESWDEWWRTNLY